MKLLNKRQLALIGSGLATAILLALFSVPLRWAYKNQENEVVTVDDCPGRRGRLIDFPHEFGHTACDQTPAQRGYDVHEFIDTYRLFRDWLIIAALTVAAAIAARDRKGGPRELL